MTKTILLTILAVGSAASAARAQAPAATPGAAQQPIILKADNMQVQAHSAANRPDRAPVYPGGEQALGLFFLENIKYPEAARVKALSGIVLVTATVNADGSVTNPVVAKSLSPECDAEALRVVPLLTGWQPAMRKGRPVPVLIQLPVPFGGAGNMKIEMNNRPSPAGVRRVK
ncbi:MULTISPECIES: energy transducer TonB [Hymenobacter]|uniref:Energy transducer TonB n=1 Tax=Hymenobacter armeniacus TaxID=2771358 RepID=A0ABR8JVB8_9BACT|nr:MULTISPECIES: energy transducer TonB [Hymenobacter]MBD2722462.1 energy transducer TonB [Hymenobacter armeniacus]MBJ6110806.1 energy transducer TonB [Hymenobacter sp. BT523]